MIEKLYEYVKDVKSGKIKTGLEIKQAVTRFENDLNRKDIFFDESKVKKVINFVNRLQHFTGKFNDQYFILEGWQVFILANMFGWVWVSTGLRRFTTSYVEVARKNGKSALAAVVALYCLIADGEANAQIILAANSAEQAQYCFDAVKGFSEKLDRTGKIIRVLRNEVLYKDNQCKRISADPTRRDGANASCVIYDEFHESKTTKLFDVLRSSQGMRTQPIFLTITTAGFSKKLPCYSLRQTAKDVLQGLKEDDTQFIAIYTGDEGDRWQDSKNWVKSNPNLNVTVIPEFLKSEVNKATNNISAETGVKTKHFNQWCDTLTTWIGSKYILDVSADVSFEMLNPDEDEICVGVDLSSNSDLTSVTYMWFKNSKYHFKTFYYLPEDNLNSVADREYYKVQHMKGNITLTPGNCVDYDKIMNDILTVNNKYIVSKIAYDTWNSTAFVLSCNENGLTMIQYIQSVANFNRPTKEFERLVLKGDVVIDNNEMTRWMLGNVHLRSDSNGNVKPDKRQNAKIDGVITMLSALGIYLETPHYNITII